jgi:uncharacterized metal-binding protein
MADGKTHDAVGLSVAGAIAGFGVAYWLGNGSPYVLYTGAVTAWGIWMFGPDLDTQSNPSNRWGLLEFIWTPYQKATKHRSIWTHIPLLSTVIRVCYLSAIGWCFWQGLVLLSPGIAAPFGEVIGGVVDWLGLSGRAGLWVLITGLFIGDLVHWLADGCPIGTRRK